MIGLFINKDLKLRKRKGKRKTGSVMGVYKYQRATKVLVISEPIVVWQSLVEFGKMSCDFTTAFHCFPFVL